MPCCSAPSWHSSIDNGTNSETSSLRIAVYCDPIARQVRGRVGLTRCQSMFQPGTRATTKLNAAPSPVSAIRRKAMPGPAREWASGRMSETAM